MSHITLDEISQISILTPIKEGLVPGDQFFTYRMSLELLLGSAMRRIDAVGTSPLRNIPTLVYAQWNILGIEGPGDGWLFLNAAFNGEPMQYLSDLRDVVEPEMDVIYQHCIGYPASKNKEAFLDYAKRHTVDTQVFYPSSVLRHRTMRDLRRDSGVALDHIVAQN